MNHWHWKLFLGLIVVMAVSMLFCMKATAGIVIEDYNAKLNKTVGVITNVQGNKLTLRTDVGKFITIGVRGDSQEDKNKIRRFKTGDRLIIEDGTIMEISAPQKQPLRPTGGAPLGQGR